MDTIATFGPIVQQVLAPFADLQYAHGDFHNELVFDTERGRYVVMSVGWDKAKRVHRSIVHIDIIGDKVWVLKRKAQSAKRGEPLQAMFRRAAPIP
jgi:hypothetical protein